MRYIRHALTLAIALLAISCVKPGSKAQNVRRDQNLLSRAEITAAQVRNAFELIERERPRWLQPRVARTLTGDKHVMVYVNDTPLGDINSLRQLSLEGVELIRFLDHAQARVQLPAAGVGMTAGVIQVITATGRR